MQLFNGILLLVSVSFIQLSVASIDTHDETNQQWLDRFYNNTAQVMNEIPRKKYPQTSLFSKESIQSGQYVLDRGEFRDALLQKNLSQELSFDSQIQGNDLPENLVDNNYSMLTHLEEMQPYQSATLATQPWSDSYWPIFLGTLSARYADPSFPSSGFKDAYDYSMTTNPPEHLLENASSIDTLSPAEKYDILIGDTEHFSLTHANWREGKRYYDESGKVEDWMGLCNGWSLASFTYGRPAKLIKVLAADGKTELTFYPSDIKALATELFAKARFSTRIMGGRCNEKNPARDENGRILSQDCFDTNPGAFHQAIVNQIGVSKRSMVFDATYDYEIWNYPILGYSYQLFNPQTRQTATDPAQAMILVEDFTNDRFKKFRSPNAKYLAGVTMTVDYILESHPSHAETDAPENDWKNSVTYRYDLELDENHRIIGGEWYQNAHPDFVWLPAKGVKIRTPFDSLLQERWSDLTSTMPESWVSAAKQAARQETPLEKIVSRLVIESNL